MKGVQELFVANSMVLIAVAQKTAKKFTILQGRTNEDRYGIKRIENKN